MKATKEMLEMAIIRGFDDVSQALLGRLTMEHYYAFVYEHAKERIDRLTEAVLDLNKYIRELDQLKQAEGKK